LLVDLNCRLERGAGLTEMRPSLDFKEVFVGRPDSIRGIRVGPQARRAALAPAALRMTGPQAARRGSTAAVLHFRARSGLRLPPDTERPAAGRPRLIKRSLMDQSVIQFTAAPLDYRRMAPNPSLGGSNSSDTRQHLTPQVA
jgi:hypothetical protein